MSSNAPQPPNLDRIEKEFKGITSLTNTLTEFLRLFVGMIRKRDWVGLVTFMIAVAIIFVGTKFTLTQFIKEPLLYGIWIVIGIAFLVGVILELRKKATPKVNSTRF
jgi:hypothetical protein